MIPQHTAYIWRGEHWCSDEIVKVYAANTRAAAGWLLKGNVPGTKPSEEQLDQIADTLGIDRSTVHWRDFPVRLDQYPEPPTFCRRCLRWFS